MENDSKRYGWDEEVVRVNPRYHLYGPIGHPEEYIEDLTFIRSLGEGEVCSIYCNSPGGAVDTGLAIAGAVRDSPADFIFHVDSECSSAATFVMLQCSAWRIDPNARIFIHNYQGGSMGSGHEMFKQLEFEREWSRQLLNDIYRHFLTDEEIDKVLNNDVIFMSGQECSDRLNKRMEILIEEYESQNPDEE